ncbi:MAG: hypothetical protein ACJ72W_04210 [Actinoallomurus sp.]
MLITALVAPVFIPIAALLLLLALAELERMVLDGGRSTSAGEDQDG